MPRVQAPLVAAGAPSRAAPQHGPATQVLIVGAGPVGLTLALDLGQRGVRCTLVERNPTSIQLPKMERCNGRTMEIYRRLGIAETVRAAGLPREAPMDVFLTTSLADPPLVHLPYPSVADARADIAAHNDGTRLLEPYQLISQYTLEPLLRSLVERLPSVDVRFGCELLAYTQNSDGVVASIDSGKGPTTLQASYLVGCDGGSSTVRKQAGIQLHGRGGIRTLRQALFYCPDLYERLPFGKGRHYHIARPPLFPFIILQDSTRHWTLHAAGASDAEMAPIFAASLGMPLPFDVLSVNEWTQHLLCADRYRDGRAFIAGDAAHLVIPTGGLGMNTGVGDAVDLAWKLAGTLAGWGGPGLLESYEPERRPIGLRNIKASGAAMAGRDSWRAARGAEMARLFDAEQRKVTEIQGIEAGYQYVDSPIIWPEDGERPDPDAARYTPTTWPGARLPHVWLEDGTALHDRLGVGYTLLRLGGTSDTWGLENAVRQTGAPLDVLEIGDRAAREVYGCDLVLVRPDLHVAWRGNSAPAEAEAIASRVTGWEGHRPPLPRGEGEA
ncbi:MAG: FAD-dependent monooxygenase [Chloroflexi bacterium]|nr:FAD-dependent monooxygenase [Chloroflexota bacterium]